MPAALPVRPGANLGCFLATSIFLAACGDVGEIGPRETR